MNGPGLGAPPAGAPLGPPWLGLELKDLTIDSDSDDDSESVRLDSDRLGIGRENSSSRRRNNILLFVVCSDYAFANIYGMHEEHVRPIY